MSSSNLPDNLSFLEKADRGLVRFPPTPRTRSSSWGDWIVRGVVLAASGVMIAYYLDHKGIVNIPGLPGLDATAPRATTSTARKASPADLPKRGRSPIAAPIVSRPRTDPVKAEAAKRAERPPVEAEPEVPMRPEEAKRSDDLPRNEARPATDDQTKDKAVGPVAALPEATADRGPVEVLKTFGLTQSGAYFLLASESEVYAALKSIRPVMIRMASAGDALMANAQVEATFQEYDDTRIRFEEQLKHLLLMIPQMPRGTIAQKTEFRQAMELQYETRQNLVAINADLDIVRKRRLSPRQLVALQEEFQARRKDYLQAASNLRTIVDKVMSEYATLRSDSHVSQALKALGDANRFKAQLGPSSSFRDGIAKVIEAERTYSPETAPARARPKRKTKR